MSRVGIPRMNQVAPENLGISVSSKVSVISISTGKLIEGVNDVLKKSNLPQYPRYSVGSNSLSSNKSVSMLHDEYREELERIETSNGRKERMTLLLPVHTKNISGWTTKGFYASNFPNCPGGMESVRNVGFFFVTKAGKRFDKQFCTDTDVDFGNAKYEIFSGKGALLFFAVETLQAYYAYPSLLKNIDFTVTGVTGGIVFQITGTNKEAQVFSKEGFLGSVKRFGFLPYYQPSRKLWNYIVQDKTGTEILRFFAKTHKTKHSVYIPNVKSSFAEFRGDWGFDMSKTAMATADPSTISPYGLNLYNYWNKLDPTKKTLALAATLIIYDRIQTPTNYGPNKKRFKSGVLFNICIAGICLLLLIVMILVPISQYDKSSLVKKNKCPK